MTSFAAYLDDSGTAREHPIATASALIIPVNLIEKLDENWARFVKKHGIPDFHAAACAAPTSKEKHYEHWNDEKKSHAFMRVRQFCKRFGAQVFGFAVHKKVYDEVVPENFRYYGGDYYTWALRNVLKKTYEWQQARRIKNPIQHIFDWQERGDPVRDEIDDLVGQYNEFHGELHHDFQRRRLVPALQCADLIAWLCFQLAMEILHKKPMNRFADESLKDIEAYIPSGGNPTPDKKWFQLIAVERLKLEKWIDFEIKSGLSMARFQDWYRRHPSRELLLNDRKKRISEIRETNSRLAKNSVL